MAEEGSGTCGGQEDGKPKGGSSMPSRMDIDWSKVDNQKSDDSGKGKNE